MCVILITPHPYVILEYLLTSINPRVREVVITIGKFTDLNSQSVTHWGVQSQRFSFFVKLVMGLLIFEKSWMNLL